MPGGVLADVIEVSLLATRDKTFRDGFQFLPAGADLSGLRRRNFVIGGGGGDDVQQVGEFLHNLVGGRNQIMRVRGVFGVEDEKAARTLADPLDQPVIGGAGEQGFNAVERIARAAAGGVVRRFGPFIDHGKRQAEIGGDLFGRLLFENLVEQFVGLHGQTMKKPGPLGKREARLECRFQPDQARKEFINHRWTRINTD